MISRGMHEKGGARFTAKEFGVFCEKLIGMSSEEIQERYELPQDYAEVLIPSAILYRKILDMTGCFLYLGTGDDTLRWYRGRVRTGKPSGPLPS